MRPAACCKAFWESGGSRGLVLVQAGGRWRLAPGSQVADRVERDTPCLGRARALEGGFWQLLPLAPGRLTLACRLNGDLLAAVTPAGRGHGGHPQQVLLPAVEVGDPVEELLWTRLVLARSLRDGGEEALEPRLLGLQPQSPWGTWARQRGWPS